MRHEILKGGSTRWIIIGAVHMDCLGGGVGVSRRISSFPLT